MSASTSTPVGQSPKSHVGRAGAAQGWRGLAVLVTTLLLLASAAGTLWYQDWRYSLPTRRPLGLQQIALGSNVAEELRGLESDERPLFLHFTSPDCPCSRFVLDQLRALVRAQGDAVRFVAVIEGLDALADGDVSGLGLPQLFDPHGRLAARLGVYSTPQAVILTADGTLWYRGNYNAARFCVQPRTAFAQQALEALLADIPRPEFPASATLAYGCALSNGEGLE